MLEHSLYIIYGTGSDSVGLVGRITKEISKINGNIVDMRQDVMHGLFTIFLVTDFSNSGIGLEGLKKLVEKLSLDTNLNLILDKYYPVPRSSDKKNMLLVLIGSDKPGIIAAISESLSKYNINIEFSQNIARAGMFLMELLADISRCTLPVQNLKTELKKTMNSLNINTMFQTEDVFNKKKRVILFHINKSFIEPAVIQELLKQADIKPSVIKAMASGGSASFIKEALKRLDNLPFDVLNTVIQSVKPMPATLELLQTLKVMGYKIAIVSSAFSCFTDYLKSKLGLDYSYGFQIQTDSDSKSVIGEMSPVDFKAAIDGINKDKILTDIMRSESVDGENITIVDDSDENYKQVPGFSLEFDMKTVLDYMNQHVISEDNLAGLLGSFGVPVIL